MAFPALEALLTRLRCPRCGVQLERDGERLRCLGACDHGEPRRFPMIGPQPALVDFERSVLNPDELAHRAGTSAVPRHGERRGLLRRLYARSTPTSARFAKRLEAELSAGDRRPTLLVIGGGTLGDGLRQLYDDPRVDVVAFDLYVSPWTQLIADAHAVPLASGSVDAVWIQAVLEHVLDPPRVAAEIERVLVPGGWLYAETPFLQQVHEGPYDFTRFTESGHRWLFRGFERVDSGVVAGPGIQMAWSIEHLVTGLLRSRTAGRIARLLFFWVQWLDEWIPERFAIDGASCVFFFGRKAERALTPREMVAEYRGAQRTEGERSADSARA
jgi:SAM-dependent methyltransferase